MVQSCRVSDCQQPACSSLQIHKQTTINKELCAIDVRTQIATQKHCWPGQVARLARPPQRYSTFHVFPLVLILQVFLIELSLYRAGE